jgi:hypothetical protein
MDVTPSNLPNKKKKKKKKKNSQQSYAASSTNFVMTTDCTGKQGNSTLLDETTIFVQTT